RGNGTGDEGGTNESLAPPPPVAGAPAAPHPGQGPRRSHRRSCAGPNDTPPPPAPAQPAGHPPAADHLDLQTPAADQENATQPRARAPNLPAPTARSQ